MTAIFYDDIFLQHETGAHPECPDRLVAIVERLRSSGLWNKVSLPAGRDATTEELTRVHTAELVDEIGSIAASGGGNYDADTVISPGSFDVALRAAGTVLAATELVASKDEGSAFCLVRPPGHHATPDRAMGFCLFNNVAVAARHAIDALGLERVAIIDWDVHHGNGTQDAFYEDGNVFYLSSHMYPHYPGTGGHNETGAGDGAGTTLNIPLLPHTPADEHMRLLRAAIEGPVADFGPKMVFISAGFDSAFGDMLGALMLTPDNFEELARLCTNIASAGGGGVVAALEGGYSLDLLSQCCEATLRGLMGTDAAGTSPREPGPRIMLE